LIDDHFGENNAVGRDNCVDVKYCGAKVVPKGCNLIPTECNLFPPKGGGVSGMTRASVVTETQPKIGVCVDDASGLDDDSGLSAVSVLLSF
jgi:hypothetical protein